MSNQMSKPSFKIYLTDSDFPDTTIEDAILAPLTTQVIRRYCRTTQDVIEQCADADALLVQWARVDAQVLDQLTRLKVIVRFGIGVDMIDIPAATARGVAVCNTPDYCTAQVATHAMTLLLTLARSINSVQAAVNEQHWGFKAVSRPIYNLPGQTLGLVGLGRIGRRVSEMARAFGLKVIAFDPYATSTDIPLVSLSELLSQADYISLHSPLTNETQNMFNTETLRAMKPTAYLINTSRGGLVDSVDLNVALRKGTIAGAALDVLSTEPPDWRDPLLSAPNLILTPHLAWYSLGAPEEMRGEAAGALAQILDGKRPSGLLNTPAISSTRWKMQ